MCFSENMSLAVGTIGLILSAHFYKKNIYASIGIGYFSLMEIIQYFQYKVIDKLDWPLPSKDSGFGSHVIGHVHDQEQSGQDYIGQHQPSMYQLTSIFNGNNGSNQ